ncbi:hypothetical protein ACTZWW_18860 [Salinarimonas sp. NSM]|uniref:hypothetical protein n=1 Tax=Salinarimonas sp. NSM TaxID=3458003 RepID=UPI004035C8BE
MNVPVKVTRDPRRPAGFAHIAIAAALPTGAPIQITREHPSKPHLGPAGWQAQSHDLKPLGVESTDMGVRLVVGPDVVNEIEEYERITIAIRSIGLQSEVDWPSIPKLARASSAQGPVAPTPVAARPEPEAGPTSGAVSPRPLGGDPDRAIGNDAQGAGRGLDDRDGRGLDGRGLDGRGPDDQDLDDRDLDERDLDDRDLDDPGAHHRSREEEEDDDEGYEEEEERKSYKRLVIAGAVAGLLLAVAAILFLPGLFGSEDEVAIEPTPPPTELPRQDTARSPRDEILDPATPPERLFELGQEQLRADPPDVELAAAAIERAGREGLADAAIWMGETFDPRLSLWERIEAPGPNASAALRHYTVARGQGEARAAEEIAALCAWLSERPEADDPIARENYCES